MQLEMIILSPEMHQNSPTTISDFKIFPGGETPGHSLKGEGKGRIGKGG